MAVIQFSQDEAGLSTSPYIAGPAVARTVPTPSPTSTAPYLVPAVQPTTGQLIQLVPRPGGAGDPLRIEVSPPDPLEGATQVTRDMFDLVFRQSKVAPRLLQEIAAFPAGVLNPPRRALPVQKIAVAIVPVGSMGEDTAGYTHQDFYSAAYDVDLAVRYDYLSQTSEYTYWPPVCGLPQADYIRWAFWHGGTRMAVSLFHELIHIWFWCKYHFYPRYEHRSGHGPYKCPEMGFTFYDIVPYPNQTSPQTPVFQDWLSQFAAEADAQDQAVKPPVNQQRPVKTPWNKPCGQPC